uniref:Putative pheromone n=1 Tax=Flammulina velutipes TaxID=38945 RepID=M4MCK8_FLAVE|nr:putative pheromone precursor [Flammulina velutipes]QPK40840.1 putative pheromone precursor [Flammulina velutipes]
MDAFTTLFTSFEDVPDIEAIANSEEPAAPLDYERAGDPTFRGGACIIA